MASSGSRRARPQLFHIGLLAALILIVPGCSAIRGVEFAVRPLLPDENTLSTDAGPTR